MAKLSPLTLLLVVGIVVVLMAPAILEAFTGLISKAWDTWQDLLNVGDGSGTTSSANLGLQIYYADGSTKSFKPEPLMLLPLTIADGGGEVTKIDLVLFVDMRYEGTISQWSCESLLVAHIKEGTTIKVSEFKSWGISVEGTTWQAMRKEIARKTVTAQQLESATAPFGDGTYNLNLIFGLTMRVDFSDGTTDTKGADAVPAIWTYEYCSGIDPEPKGAISSLNVHIGIKSLRP